MGRAETEQHLTAPEWASMLASLARLPAGCAIGEKPMMDQVGRYDPASSLGLADTKVADARRPTRRVDRGRWPSIVTVLRAFAVSFLLLVIAGWILTAVAA